jgi:oxygen-dependent protoporphyrinogen oxidase
MTPQAILTTSLLGAGTKWKIISEPFRRTKPPSEDESIADFVRRKFGHEILEYLVAPFVSGVYAGDPEKLSLRAAFPSLEEWEREYGSVLRGAMKSRPSKSAATETASKGPPPLCSFRRGLSTLTRAMAARLGGNARAGAHVGSLARAEAGAGASYQIHLVQEGREETIVADQVVIATPAYVAGRLVTGIPAAPAHALSGIAYAGVAVVASGYYGQQARDALNGFGVLIPRSEKHRTLGIVWNSSLFPGRAPSGQFTITSFAGGATDPEMADRPEEEIAAIVEADHAKILGITGQPVALSVWRHPKALPQYNLGHGHVVRAIRECERATPGLYFAGNYIEGPSIGKCVERAFETADAIRDSLQRR